MKLIINVAGIGYFLVGFYLIYKIQECYLRFKAIVETRRYSDYYFELNRLQIQDTLGMLPLLITLKTENWEAIAYLVKRKICVVLFWLLFVLGNLASLVYILFME